MFLEDDDRIGSTDRHHIPFENYPWHDRLGIDPEMSSKSSGYIAIVGEASHSENRLQDFGTEASGIDCCHGASLLERS